LNAALARSVVRIQSRFAGRGPNKAQAFFRHNFVVVVMEDAMTTLEHSLARDGDPVAVLATRRQLQTAMRTALVAEVERLTRCRVLAFLSDNHIEPDVSAELFVLDRSIADERPDAEPDAPA
jgi:uncharacterized protein YbcI